MNTEKCWLCGKEHPMALTPFPMEEGWPCPYDATRKAYKTRVSMVDPLAASKIDDEADYHGEGVA